MEQGHELVVCIHGLGRTRRCWWLLRRRLERAGYRTDAWTYPSLLQSIEDLGRDCRRRLEAYVADSDVRQVHVVTHSLGGIIIRQALGETGVRCAICGEREKSRRPDTATRQRGKGKTAADEDQRQSFELEAPPGLSKLGTIVMLAPPNCGSVWARRLGPWLGRLVPALPQLSDTPGSLVNRLGPLPSIPGLNGQQAPRLAVIAGAKDGKCPLPTTHLPGQTAHMVVPGRHTLIMYRRDVADAIISMLANS
jgi:pimeloyl-ACP methyl ester carboxylesterase